MIVAHIGDRPLRGHPMIPVLQVSGDVGVAERFGADLDLVLTGERALSALLERIAETASGRYEPRLAGAVGFQLTRGLLGISL